ncbi:MAG: protein kinase [Sandaracinus sp.]
MGQVPKIGDVVAGKYRLESVLGRGGMGVVFAARHTLSERRVALKWMEADEDAEADALARFVREARAMGRIEHPNVVGVLDVGTEGDVAYLVMEILRGESLRSTMAEAGPLSVERAVALLLPALEGVEAAHRAGVVHRDLKPENLFVVKGPDGEPQTTKVLDFGISKLTEHEGRPLEAQKLTKTGHVVGTPTYMSPEQVRGGTIDARTDVWALSVILYEMLAGKTPFAADNYGALLVAIAVEPYEPLDPAIVPPDVARVVHRGLAKEAEDRWPTVEALARALEPFARGARYREPRHPSLAPPAAEPARGSSVPTAAARPSPVRAAGAPVAAAGSAATPELALPSAPAGRASPEVRGGAPTPIRLGAAAARAEAAPVEPPQRRWLVVAAVAVAALLALGMVVRQIGHAARDAMLRAPLGDAATPDAPVTTAPPPSRAATPAHEATPAPPTAPAHEATPAHAATPHADPPPPLPVPRLSPEADAPAHGSRRGEHGHAPSASATSATPAPSAPAPAPPTTTATSRSGSISRDDF